MYALNGFTAKHRVLLNLDLLSYIVQLISGRHSTASTETVYDDRLTLTKLVRVSKLFLDPALNELWWSLNNLTPVSTLYETLLSSKTQVRLGKQYNIYLLIDRSIGCHRMRPIKRRVWSDYTSTRNVLEKSDTMI